MSRREPQPRRLPQLPQGVSADLLLAALTGDEAAREQVLDVLATDAARQWVIGGFAHLADAQALGLLDNARARRRAASFSREEQRKTLRALGAEVVVWRANYQHPDGWPQRYRIRLNFTGFTSGQAVTVPART